MLVLPLTLGGQGGGQATFLPTVGERLEYDLRLKLGALSFGRVGTGYTEVTGVDTVRGRPAYHLVFAVKGGIIGFHVDDTYESWVDVETGASLRHIQRIREGGYRRTTTYEMIPERATYTENGGPERPSVEQALDDCSFLYFVRASALEVGDRRELTRYFKPAQNPVVLVAERRDSITVPAGRFDAVVVRPSIRSGGMFGEGGRAEVWLGRDAQRLMLQLTAHLPFGTLNLSLRSVPPSAAVVAAAAIIDRQR